MEQTHKIEWEPDKNTHENIIFVCFGGLSNTGITTSLASLEVVRVLRLNKVGVGCLGALPTNIQPLYERTKVTKKIITVDGYGKECAKKIVEKAGIPISKSIILVRDIGMKNIPFYTDVASGEFKGMDAYISEKEIQDAKELILNYLI